MTDAVSIIHQLLQGLGLLGNAVTSAVKAALAYFGLNIPDYATTLATIVFLILLLYKFGNAINKIILFALIFMLISSLAGLATPFLQLWSI
jgi:hypothetical protein